MASGPFSGPGLPYPSTSAYTYTTGATSTSAAAAAAAAAAVLGGTVGGATAVGGEDILVPPHHAPPNPEDEDDVVPEMHAAFGIQRATQQGRFREPAWRDLALDQLLAAASSDPASLLDREGVGASGPSGRGSGSGSGTNATFGIGVGRRDQGAHGDPRIAPALRERRRIAGTTSGQAVSRNRDAFASATVAHPSTPASAGDRALGSDPSANTRHATATGASTNHAPSRGRVGSPLSH